MRNTFAARQRGSTAQQRPGPMSVRLESNHLFVNYGVVLTAIASFVFLWAPNLNRLVAPHATGKSYLIIGVLLAVVLAAATATKRRVLAGMAAILLAIAPWGPEYFLQIMVFALGIWHMVQVARVTRAANNKEADPARPEATDRRLQVPELARSFMGRIGRLATSPAVPQPLGLERRGTPAASKRYTPPSR